MLLLRFWFEAAMTLRTAALRTLCHDTLFVIARRLDIDAVIDGDHVNNVLVPAHKTMSTSQDVDHVVVKEDRNLEDRHGHSLD